MLTLYNTLSRKKEKFVPLDPPCVGIYSCGPTVYNYAHIGNLRTYIFSDVLKRVLQYDGFKLKHVMNITDVGHLTSDADEGEDKMETGARREGKSVWDIAEYYTEAFLKDMQALNITEPEIWCRATEHIKEQIAQIEALDKGGFTYATNDGIYFDTDKLEDYGKLARLKKEDLQAGKRVDIGEKRHKTDFALWKFSPKEGPQRQMEWDSPWGKGFPGWHIECSAMSTKYLGKHFDIHTGGIDHIQVHHTNEIAQAECAHGKQPWVNYWMHSEFLVLSEGKMAKSEENFLTLASLDERDYPLLSYRYLCLTAHYRQQLQFSWEAMASAKASYERLKNIIAELQAGDEVDEKKIAVYLEQFQKAIDDDLNMPQALAVLWDALRDTKLGDGEKRALIERFDAVLGLRLLETEEIEVPADVQKLLDEREAARATKDFKKSDELREQIRLKGFSVDDRKDGYRIKKG